MQCAYLKMRRQKHVYWKISSLFGSNHHHHLGLTLLERCNIGSMTCRIQGCFSSINYNIKLSAFQLGFGRTRNGVWREQFALSRDDSLSLENRQVNSLRYSWIITGTYFRCCSKANFSSASSLGTLLWFQDDEQFWNLGLSLMSRGYCVTPITRTLFHVDRLQDKKHSLESFDWKWPSSDYLFLCLHSISSLSDPVILHSVTVHALT